MTSELPGSTRRSAPIDDRFSAAYEVLEAAIASRAFPGCSFGVLYCGEIVLHDALGKFTYDDAPKVTPDTVFDVASLTKVVATTAAAMLLHQRGALDLETPVGDLLPGFVVGRPPGTCARHVKIRHLLAHNSGLPGYVEFFRNQTSPATLYKACLELPLEAAPGERAEYSDPGFILLGKALEMIMRQSLPAWVQREIFAPLEMASTGFNPPRRHRNQIPPTEHDSALRHRVIQGEVQDENAWLLGGAAGHAGLFSNVPDLLRFADIILASRRTDDAQKFAARRLFEADTIRIFSERQGPEGSSRALGWDTPSATSSAGRFFSPDTIGHLGYSGCSMWLDLKDDVGIVLLTNRTWPDRKNNAIREVRPAFHNAVREALLDPGRSSFATP